MPQHLHLDPFSGIAGDMFLGALVDLGANPQTIQETLAPLDLSPSWQITTHRVMRHSIGAVDLKVKLGPSPTAHHHHHVGHSTIMAMIDRLELSDRAQQRARRVVTLLGEAEARVHQKPLDAIHFHEVGAVDSIVDLLGSVIALEQLDIDTLSCGTLPISSGFVRCAHGMMPIPAPATAYLLEGLPCVGVDRKGELITPTGAALVRGLCETFGPPPALTLSRVGYGAGDREDPQIPNLLRVLHGVRS
ncbi:MAG: LarC family nickel insertion protein [Algisphaera sp.]